MRYVASKGFVLKSPATTSGSPSAQRCACCMTSAACAVITWHYRGAGQQQKVRKGHGEAGKAGKAGKGQASAAC